MPNIKELEEPEISQDADRYADYINSPASTRVRFCDDCETETYHADDPEGREFCQNCGIYSDVAIPVQKENTVLIDRRTLPTIEYMLRIAKPISKMLEENRIAVLKELQKLVPLKERYSERIEL